MAVIDDFLRNVADVYANLVGEDRFIGMLFDVLDVLDGEIGDPDVFDSAFLLRLGQGAPDFEDETRVRFPAVSLVPVENFRRSEPDPAPDPGDAEVRRASRRAVMLRNDQP